MNLARLASRTGFVAFVCILAASAPAADWAQFRGPTHNGVSPEVVAGQDQPKELWRIPLGEGFSQVIVAKDRGYVFAKRDAQDGPKPQEEIVCLDLANGKTLWSTLVGESIKDGNGNGPRSSPAIDGDRVYAYGTHLKLVCLNAADGKLVWEKDIAKEFGGRNIGWGSSCSPIIDGDKVFVFGGGKGQSLLAFKKDSGELAWKAQDDGLTHTSPVAVTIHGVRQILYFTAQGLVAVTPDAGKVLWRYDFPHRTSTAASPVVFDGDHVYCSAAYGVGAGVCKVTKDGDAFTAKEVWRTPNKNMNHWTTSVYHDGHIYGIFGHVAHGKNPLGCIDARTGEEKWMEGGFGPGGVMLANKQLVVISDKGRLVALPASPDGFKPALDLKAVNGSKCWTMPTLADGKLYVRAYKEAVCYDVGGQAK